MLGVCSVWKAALQWHWKFCSRWVWVFTENCVTGEINVYVFWRDRFAILWLMWNFDITKITGILLSQCEWLRHCTTVSVCLYTYRNVCIACSMSITESIQKGHPVLQTRGRTGKVLFKQTIAAKQACHQISDVIPARENRGKLGERNSTHTVISPIRY